MKTYSCFDDGIPVSGWCTTTTLHLHDNGRFDCDEVSTCYWGTARRNASGRWQQQGNKIVFFVEKSDGLDFKAGEQTTAEEKDEYLFFPSLRMDLEKR